MLKNTFSFISFENISLLDSYLIHWYIIIKLRSNSNKGKNPPNIMGVIALFHLKKCFPFDNFF